MAQRHETPQLSDRERTVLLLAADGLTDKEIARNLGLSLKTVETYWDRMRQKFEANSRTQVLAQFLRIEVQEDAEASSLKRLFATWEEGVWIIDPSSETIYANQRIAEIFGLSQDSLQGLEAAEIVGTENAPQIERLLSSTGPDSAEIVAETANGERHFLYLRAGPFEDSRGARGATVILVRDITLEKRVEHALSSCENSLRFLMDHGTDLVAKFDSELRLAYLNPCFCDFLEGEESRFVGRTVDELPHIFTPMETWRASLMGALGEGKVTSFACELGGVPSTTYLSPEPSAEFAPKTVISLTRSKNGKPWAER